jgi:uncharacterized membrane protein HdeD (DUF308 family)
MPSDFFGVILMILWTLYVTVGFISQIIKNNKDKNFGWSMPLFLLAYITYIFGTLYGFYAKDPYIFVPYITGFVLLNGILYQFFKYRRKN